ncbi:MAG: acetylxylan esterase [Bacteroidales bacterium]|jgi:cephalosporin-C deacetylase-like acetyl esterase
MRRILYFLSKTALTAGMLAVTFSCRPGTQISVVTDTQWKFRTGNDLSWADPHTDDSLWDTLSISTCWEAQGYPGYDGYAWYRKEITLPEEVARAVTYYKGLEVRYQNADDADALYFNGHYIGRTGNFPPNYKSAYGEERVYVVPLAYIHTDAPNTMAIQVYDDGGEGGLLTSAVTLRPVTPAPVIETEVYAVAEDGVFKEGEPHTFQLTVRNPEEKKRKVRIHMTVSTDDHIPVSYKTYTTTLRPKAGMTWVGSMPGIEAGFYRCSLFVTTGSHDLDPVAFNFGCEPENITSISDAPEDLEVFWTETRALLDAVPMKPTLRLLPEHSRGPRNVYLVEMQSFENETIGGYYAAPKKRGKHPVIMTFMGYGSNPWIPQSEEDADFITFVVSVRGQGIYKAGNKYHNQWFISGLESKETYYYRGAYMDLVRALDFVCSRAEADTQRICAQGASQGGAFTLALCALDDRVAVAAPSIPFMSDFPVYFSIADWPASEMDAYLRRFPDTDKETLYNNLSYFDIKNLATRITAPTIMAIGLQDEICPPRTNFAGFNAITAPKVYVIYKDNAHSTPIQWQDVRMAFFREYLERLQP